MIERARIPSLSRSALQRAASRRFDDRCGAPYDILDSEDVKALYGRSPYNVVRIDLGVGEGVGDSDWHGRAGELYRTWRAEGILQQEEAPAYYALKQRYKLPTGQVKELIGVIGACALAPFGEGGVLPHEHTFSKPKEDRFKLMQTTQANISQIYGFFSDRHDRSPSASRGKHRGTCN